MKLLLIGLSHKTAPLEIRERLSLPPAALRSALTHFGPIHPQAHLEDVREGVILSTCNRLEIYSLVHRPERAARTVLSALCRAAIHTGKRARTETGIGVNSVSISSVAANLAGRLLGNLPERQVVLIGAGEMGAIAVPRDIDPEVARLPKVHLYDMDDLQEQANQNIREREVEIPHVEAIVMEEVAAFMTWLASLEATSTITHLRQKVEEVRQQELERLFKRLNLTKQEQSLVAAMSQRLTNKILHEPTLCLKQETATGNGAAFISATRQLFSLDQKTEEDLFINPKERIPCDNSFANLAMI